MLTALRRGSAAVSSQGLSTAQNLLVSFTTAAIATPAQYGAWGIGFALFLAFQSVIRAAVNTPQLLAAGTAGREADSVQGPAAITASLLVGMASSVVMCSAAAAVPPTMAPVLIAFGLSLVPAFAHDASRYLAISENHYQRLIVLDASRLALQTATTGALFLTGHASTMSLTLAWGISALGPLLWQALTLRDLFSLTAARRFYGPIWRDCVKMAAEASIGTAGANGVPIVVGAILGLTSAGYFRAGMTAMGLINVFVAGLIPVVTKTVKHQVSSGGDDANVLRQWSVALAAVTLLYSAALWMVPPQLGSLLLGDSWAGFHGALLGFALQGAARGPFMYVPISLRAREQFNAAVRFRIETSVLQVLLPCAGGYLFGFEGAVWGYAAAAAMNSLQALPAWLRSRRTAGQTPAGS